MERRRSVRTYVSMCAYVCGVLKLFHALFPCCECEWAEWATDWLSARCMYIVHICSHHWTQLLSICSRCIAIFIALLIKWINADSLLRFSIYSFHVFMRVFVCEPEFLSINLSISVFLMCFFLLPNCSACCCSFAITIMFFWMFALAIITAINNVIDVCFISRKSQLQYRRRPNIVHAMSPSMQIIQCEIPFEMFVCLSCASCYPLFVCMLNLVVVLFLILNFLFPREFFYAFHRNLHKFSMRWFTVKKHIIPFWCHLNDRLIIENALLLFLCFSFEIAVNHKHTN